MILVANSNGLCFDCKADASLVKKYKRDKFIIPIYSIAEFSISSYGGSDYVDITDKHHNDYDIKYTDVTTVNGVTTTSTEDLYDKLKLSLFNL